MKSKVSRLFKKEKRARWVRMVTCLGDLRGDLLGEERVEEVGVRRLLRRGVLPQRLQRSRLLNSRTRCICSCRRSSWAALMPTPPPG